MEEQATELPEIHLRRKRSKTLAGTRRRLSRTFSVPRSGSSANLNENDSQAQERAWNKIEKRKNKLEKTNSISWRRTSFTTDNKIIKKVVVSEETGYNWKHYSCTEDSLPNLQYYLKLDNSQVQLVEKELKQIEQEEESKRINRKFEKLDLDLLDSQLFEKRMSGIITERESTVSDSARKHLRTKRTRSAPRGIIRKLSLSPRTHFCALSDLTELKLKTILFRSDSHVLWEAKLANQPLVAKQYFQCTGTDKRKIRRKARMMRKLENPHLLVHYGVGCHNDSSEYFLFREIIKGASLCEFIDLDNTMNELAASQVILQVLRAISFLHEKEIIHGNIRPEKILLSTKGIVKVSGFDSVPNALVAVPRYSAPEVVINGEFTKTSDIWSIGCVLAELLTGKAPFYSKDAHETIQDKMNGNEIPEMPKNVSASCCTFLSSCWKVNSDERPSADDLLNFSFLDSLSGHSALSGFVRRKLYKKEPSENYLRSHSLAKR